MWAPSYIFETKAYIDNRKKNLLNIDTSSIRPHNMVSFGLLTAEIRWRVWSTPANFNGFRVLAALLHGTNYRHFGLKTRVVKLPVIYVGGKLPVSYR